MNLWSFKFRYLLEPPKAFLPAIGRIERIEKMGNQQETNKAYIAGILDGEGCIHLSLQCQKQKGPNSQGTLHHIVQIANTSKPLVDYLTNWFDQETIPYHVHWTRPKGKNQKIYAQVRITRFHGIKKFLTLVLPYLVIKTKQANLLLEFTETRLKNFEKTEGRFKPSYTDRDFEIMAQLKILNQRGLGPSTTIRETLKGDDIVSSRGETHELR
jgi:hypothetical protein